MAEKCPACGTSNSVEYNPYHKVTQCIVTGCTYRVEDKEKETYSTIRYNPKKNIGQRVEFDNKGVEIRVLKEWDLLLQFAGKSN